MKKLLLIAIAILGISTAQAQNSGFALEVNGGVLTHDFIVNGVEEGKTLDIGQASFGFEWDFFAKNKFNFGPSAKLYAQEIGFEGGKDDSLNHYHGSIGLMAGVDLGKFSFNTSFESLTPQNRGSIFEAVVSPSAAFMISDKVGIKANFDYFFNKKLFNHAYTIGGGLIYKF